MEPLLNQKISRESISFCIDELTRKYFALPESDRNKMSEQDVRDYFVTPLLEALGWGRIDPRERAAEKYLPRKGFSDYEICLPIGSDPQDPYLPILYVEAKKFNELTPLQKDLFGYEKRSEADIQAIEYADQYNPKRREKIGWAILTNFEIFRLWDTHRGVLVESTNWFNEFKRDQTLEVLFLLSRDQVAQDPRLVSLSSYRKLPDIDEKFLSKLNEWRAALADAIWKHRPNRMKLGGSLAKQQDNLREVVQRILDRMIVIRTAEDRGLLPPPMRLQEMVRSFGGQNAVPLMLLKNIQNNTFRFFDYRYNSKLFGAHLADEMEVHNTPLTLIIEEMCQAGFASMNADILGTTYEQYLGQTIEIKTQEDSPRLVPNLDTRHAQGSYYTPRFVVKDIVDHTLGRYLYGTEDGLPHDKPNPGELRKTIAEIQDLSLLDPACGSGSFLIYAFDVLLNFYSAERDRLNREIDSRIASLIKSGLPPLVAQSRYDPEIITLKSQLEFTRSAHARIIERHLYGVDLDPQAAEVASMNLLLKALTRDERLPRILGDNIKVGNSLISGISSQKPLTSLSAETAKLVDIRREIHRATLAASENGADREECEKRIDQLERDFRVIADTLNRGLNKPLLKSDDSGWFDDPESRHPFNWQIEFPEVFSADDAGRHGFTFVIGNPPYVGFHGFAQDKPFLRDTYSTSSGKFDIYVPFLERGLTLACRGGRLSFICPSTFMKRDFGRKLRRFLLSNSKLERIHDFLHTKIFREALNYTCIVVLSHEVAPTDHAIAYSEGPLDGSPRPYFQNKLSDSPWVFRFGAEESLVEGIKSDKDCKPLGSAELIRGISEGIVTGKNAALMLHEEDVKEHGLELDLLRKCLRGEDVKRYSVNWGHHYVIYPYHLLKTGMEVIPEKLLKETCPNLHSYLSERKSELKSRTYFKGTNKLWYELWCPRDIRDQESEKIIVPELADRSQFAWVGKDFFYVDTTCGMASSQHEVVDSWYLLSVLNSAAGEYLYRKTTVPKANGFLIYKTMFLRTFPVPIPHTLQERESAAASGKLARTIQDTHDHISRVEEVFDECLRSAVPALEASSQNFGTDYYGVPGYWKRRRLMPANALQLTDPVVAMRARTGTINRIHGASAPGCFVIEYQSEKAGQWKPLIELEPIDENLGLFLNLAIRRFLAENKSKRSWRLPGGRSSKRTIDVVIGSLVLPIWQLPHGSGPQAETNLRMISELMEIVRKRINGEVDLGRLEEQIAELDHEIDQIVFRLYHLSETDQKQVLETMQKR